MFDESSARITQLLGVKALLVPFLYTMHVYSPVQAFRSLSSGREEAVSLERYASRGPRTEARTLQHQPCNYRVFAGGVGLESVCAAVTPWRVSPIPVFAPVPGNLSQALALCGTVLKEEHLVSRW